MSSLALDDHLRDRINLIDKDRALRTDCDYQEIFLYLQTDRAVRAVRIQSPTHSRTLLSPSGQPKLVSS